MEIAVNEFQTPITDELLDSLSTEAREQFLDYITNVEFIKRLISPDRPRAKDLPRRDGKIIVDIVNPHILEDMEYFRPVGNFYRKHGVLTKLRPNPSPNSDYGKWMETEINRIWYGMVRESDGEWITGNMYFYLNYTPIIQSRIRKGTKLADRVIDFPEVWEGSYLWFHYIDQARNGGLYNNWLGGEHAVQIARRGAGKSYTAAAILGKAFICGENHKAHRKVKGAVTAYQKEYLVKDGILNKFVDIIDFCAENTEFPASRIKDSINDMHWMMGYKDGITNTNKGTMNEILGISAKDDTDKSRGKRSNYFIYEEFGAFPKFIDIWNVNKSNVQEDDVIFGQAIAFGCVCKDTMVYDKNGKPYLIQDITKDKGILGFKENAANIENITYILDYAEKECVEITHSYGKLRCSIDHPILCKVPVRSRKENKRWYETKFVPANLIKEHYTIAEIDIIDIWGKELLFDAYLVGLLIGDGSYGKDKTPVLSNCDENVLNYVINNYNTVEESSKFTSNLKVYKELRIKGICSNLRQLGIYGLTKSNKRLPINYMSLNKENSSLLLAGLFDTDGYIGKNNITLVQSSYEIQYLVSLLLRKFGILCKIHKIKSSKYSTNINRESNTSIYVLEIKDKRSLYNFTNSIPLKIQYKIDSLKTLNTEKTIDNIRWRKINSIKSIGIQRIYNLTANDSHTYLANNIITHNTGGSEGSDFSGALEMIYNPIGYQVYPLPNVFDKNSQGKQMTVFFFGAYLNRKGCYNENGVSDVVMALLQEIQARIKIKYNSTDTMTLTRKKAEQAITILEAVMKRDGTFYPIADLTDVHNDLEFNPRLLDSIGVGELSITKTNEIIFKPTNDAVPIREFPHKDNKLLGCVEVHRPPVRDSSGKVMHGRYIAGIDPYDDDASDTLSLGALTILDLFTDLIVFEYTGRPMFADDFYETCRRALIWYNAECNYENNKKGLFKYFSQHNSLYLLSDTLDFLKDKELMKPGLYGNKAKGTISSAPIKAYGRRCIRDWLLKPVTITLVIDREEVDVTVPALTQMKTKALLKELMLWNPDGNFDRHDALAMLMLLREEKLRVFGVLSPTEALSNTAENYLGNDSYFETNYDKKFVGKTRMPSYFNKQ